MPDDRIERVRDKRRILESLLPEVDARRHRRLVRQAVVFALLVATAFAIARSGGDRRQSSPGLPIAREDVPPAPDAPRSWIQFVSDDPSVFARLGVVRAPRPTAIVRNRPLDDSVRIDDRQLCEWLQRAGRRAGYLRSGDHFELTHPIGE